MHVPSRPGMEMVARTHRARRAPVLVRSESTPMRSAHVVGTRVGNRPRTAPARRPPRGHCSGGDGAQTWSTVRRDCVHHNQNGEGETQWNNKPNQIARNAS
eukprot:scaffold2636_cov340-Pavlova_lutheri.AAC.100